MSSVQEQFAVNEEVRHDTHGVGLVIAALGDGRYLVKFFGPDEDHDKQLIVDGSELISNESNNSADTVMVEQKQLPVPIEQQPIAEPLTEFERRAALLTKWGIPVAPVLPGKKRTWLDDWGNQATTDPAQIRSWGKENPSANTAAVARAGGGEFLFLEFDCLEAIKHFEQETGLKVATIDTFRVRSRQGHGYLCFRHTPETIALGNNLNVNPKKSDAGVDEDGEFFSLRAHIRYMVGPLSIVNDGLHPDPYSVGLDVVPTDMPSVIVKWALGWKEGGAYWKAAKARTPATTASQSKSGSTSLADDADDADSIITLVNSNKVFGKGGRNTMVSRYAHLRWRLESCTEEELRADVREFYEKRISPPFEDAGELETIIRGKLRLEQLPVSTIGGKPMLKRTAPVFVPLLLPNDPKDAKSDEERKQINENIAQTQMERLQKEYDEAELQAEPRTEEDENPYPLDAWAGTPVGKFADVAGEKNFIPKEYFINGLATVVGSICSSRIVAKHNPKQLPTLYTVFLSEEGGDGKNTAIDWSFDLFEKLGNLKATGLIRQPGLKSSTSRNVGTYRSSFASERATLKVFMQNPNVLQVYTEFTTLLEKTSITGSGVSFRNLILDLADAPTINWSEVTDQKLPEHLPTGVYNSILAGTTKEKWEEASSLTTDKTFPQRLNIIVTGAVKTVGKLVYPDFTDVRKDVLRRVWLLETHKLVWSFSPEADEVFTRWFDGVLARKENAKNNGEAGVSQAYGRINTYAMRLIGHLALWLGELPKVLKTRTQHQLPNGWVPQTVNGDGSLAEFGDDESTDQIWEVQVTPDIVNRAIRIAEYQLKVRQRNLPDESIGQDAQCENQVKRWMVKLRWTTVRDLFQAANLYKFGITRAKKSIVNLSDLGHLKVTPDPQRPERYLASKIVWIGSCTSKQDWMETRGGRREGAGRKKRG